MGSEEKSRKGKMRIPAILSIALLSVLIALFVPLVFAEDTPDELTMGEFLPSWQLGWLPICMMAILVSALFNGLIFIIGKSISSQNLERYAISEMLNTAATAIMAVILIASLTQALDFVGGMGSVTCDGEVIKAPIDGDMCRTNEFLHKIGDKYDYVRDADHFPEIEYSLMVTLLGVPVYAGAWMNDAVFKEVETYHSIAYICVNLMIALSAKMFMLQYIKENMLTVFLPLGILLRTFHFTRGIGAFFMSIAIGFFFVYPTVCFIMDSSFAAAATEPSLPDIISVGMCNIPMFGSFSFGSAALQSTSRSGAAAGISLSNDLATFVAETQATLLYNNLVAFAIALTFIRFATTILGGDITPFLGMVGKLV
jgi:hypothetical protein